MRTCKEPGCERRHYGRGWCKAHYSRWWNALNPPPDKGPCSIDGCDKPADKRGWCGMHYRRWQRHGSPADPVRVSVEERFWSKVNKDGPVAKLTPELGRCWIWTAGTYRYGYGQFTIGDTSVRAHRFAYEQEVGPIPEGLVLDHFACENPSCVNPSHVRPVTDRENLLRGNTIQAWNLAKTHCKHGHEFTPENTVRIGPSGMHRACRECRRRIDRESHRRRSTRARQPSVPNGAQAQLSI